MKKLSLFFALLAAVAAFAASSHAADFSKKTPALIIDMIVPPTWRPLLDDNLATTFASRVSDAFKRNGFKGEIGCDGDIAPQKDQSVLTINLVEWKVDRVGNVVCTFSADLKKGDGNTVDLGMFSGTQMQMMSRGNRWALAETFGDAADDAINDLYRKVAKHGILPGAVEQK